MKATWAVAAIVLAFLLGPFPPAAASATGNCVMIIQGEDASSGSGQIEVPESGDVTYRIESPLPVVRWKVEVHYGPFTIPALDQRFPADSGLVREGVASVKDFTKYGTGQYEVTGNAELSDGTFCTARMEMIVPGSPFQSVIGLTAMALFGAGVVGLLALLIQILLNVNDVRTAIKDFVGQARTTRDEAKTSARTPGQDAQHPPVRGPDEPHDRPKS